MPLKRAYPDHPILSVSILCRRADKVLIVKRSKNPFKDHWSLPGGVVEVGETLHQAAARELQEETSLRADFHQIAEVFDSIQHDDDGKVESHFVLAVVLATAESGEAIAGDDAAALRWETPESLSELLTTPGTPDRVRRLFDAFPNA